MYVKFSIRDEKSEKCPRFSKNVYYLSRMLILHIQLYNLILSCNFFFWGGGGVLIFFFFFIANADFTYLGIYYNLIMQFMFCDTCAMYTEHCAACSNQTQTAPLYHNADSSPSKHEDLTQCCFNVGPAPLAVGQ